ncbi:hypothetical protein NQ318_014670 [Aromia moschata]|uniref:CUB domain-containing protein n=1 Tax=Aromia moschata TaxID=1265417 RepID=A0AAV8ZB14_9CUCU|nr:hypothetical protein NQ318_014670 [Aromia moschata]
MSTKKDGVKTSTSSLSKKKTTGASKSTTKTREDSTDRSNIKKTEVSNKIKKRSSSTTIANDNILEKVKLKENIKTTKPIKAKNMYANALKSDETPAKKVASNTNKEIKKSDSKTETQIHKALEKKLSGRIVPKKVLDERSKNRMPINKGTAKSKDSFRVHSKETNREVSPDSSSISERPRTATLRKGSIVNDNIVGPDAPKHLIPKVKRENTNLKAPSPEPEANEEYNYEDDFESYESDFEEYSSSSSSAADLGNISGEETSSVSTSSSSQNQTASLELTSTKRKTNSSGNDDERKLDSGNFDMSDYKHKQLLYDIKESVEKENANLKLQEVQRNNPASLSDEGFEEQKSLQFINFLDAKRKYERRKSMEIRQRRGEEILNMIRLDTFSFTLFDMPPVPYEVFIKNYGGNNSLQSAVQTGEDDISEMTQTEEIISETKWTQFPIHFPKIDPTNSNYLQICRNSHLGVGGENVNESQSEKLLFNEHNLKKFLSCAGDLILKVQLESTERFDKFQKDPRDIPFSDGFVLFDTSHDFLRNCSIRCASFSCDNTNKILTVHLPKRRENEGYYRSVVCVWNISRSDIPESIFVSYGDISCCTFGLNSTDFIYAGLKDGSLNSNMMLVLRN